MLAPLPKLENKKDLETAYAILKMNPEMDLEEIKKGYKNRPWPAIRTKSPDEAS